MATASPSVSPVRQLTTPYDRQQLEDVGFMTCMTLVLLGNYAQTGHFGGPLAYTPYNVATHLAGPELGGLRFDYRRPKHPFSDKFMLAGGHCIPTCYALWMIMGQAMARRHAATGDARYHVDPHVAMLPIDALGFRRGAGALATLLQDQGLADHPLFAQAKLRGIKALPGHAESIDVTNDVNGGPSGVGVATAAGKAAFWDVAGAGIGGPKIIAFEGEFAMTEGHAQELKTQALAMKVGKRLRVMISDNNAGIDDSLIGGVIDAKFTGYNLVEQWTSYGWNVFTVANGNDYDQVVAALKALDDVDPADRRPIALIGKTVKGYWPAAVGGKIADGADQVVGYPSHPYAMKMNSDYFLALAATFERRYGVQFQGIRDGVPKTTADRLVQFKTNMDVAMSVLDKNGIGDWLADRLVEIGDSLRDDLPLRLAVSRDPVPGRAAARREPAAGAADAQRHQPGHRRQEGREGGALPQGGGDRRHAARHLRDREVGELRHRQPVPDHRRGPVGVDQPRARQHLGPLRPGDQPRRHAHQGRDPGSGQRVERDRPGQPERLARSGQVRGRVGDQRHLRRVHAADVHAGARVEPAEPGQQVPHGRAAHPGRATRGRKRRPTAARTSASSRRRCGSCSRAARSIHLNFWDYNDVAPAYFAAAEIAAREAKVGIITLEVARPDFPVADRNTFADTDIRAAAKGFYVIRDFAPGKPRHGYVLTQGSSSTVNLVSVLPKLEAAGVNVRVIAAISEELFDRQPESYRHAVLPPEAMYDLMVVTTGTRRMWPLRNVGPLTDEYSLTSDWDNQWLTGGLEPDVITEAHLDQPAILAGIQRFARDREQRLARQKELVAKL